MIDPLARRFYSFLSERPRRPIEARDPYCLGSTVGSVRSGNEDIAAVVSMRHGGAWERDFDVAVVCDGMGGMAQGREAALIAASTFLSRVIRAGRYTVPEERLHVALEAAQLDVYDRLRGSGGTTLSAVYVDRTPEAWFVHVGDSRVSGLSNGSNPLRQLSRSDTIGAALKGDLEGRSDLNQLIQFVGMDDDLVGQIERIAPDEFDGFLLTSDGAHSASKEILEAVCRHSKSGSDLVRKLLNLSDALGGLDNSTAVYIPATLRDDTPRDAGGLPNIVLLTPGGQREIWLSIGVEGLDPRTPPALLAPPASPLPSPRPERATKSKGRSKKKQSPKPVRAENPGGTLPLEESLGPAKLDFSDDGGT